MSARAHKIPLAWLQLTRDKLRLAAALAGIAFASVLMLMQLGFSDALYVAAIQVQNAMKGDIVILHRQYEYLLSTKSFSQRHLVRQLATEGVESSAPLYVGLVNWKNSETLRDLPIFAIGVDPSTKPINLPSVEERLPELSRLNTLFYDSASKPDFGDVAGRFTGQSPLPVEVSGKKMDVIGLFQVGVSFGADGNLIMSDQTLFELHPHRRSGIIDIGLISITDGTDATEVAARIEKTLPEHLQVMTMEEYKTYEKDFWAKRTPIGFIFGLGTLMGFVVGAVIVYQILYTDVNDHLSEYATLKAMGYDDGYLSSIVIKEAIILAVLGYIPGWVIATGMLALTRHATQLPSGMTPGRSIMVLCLTIGMCAGAGLLAMRKLRSADPADIF